MTDAKNKNLEYQIFPNLPNREERLREICSTINKSKPPNPRRPLDQNNPATYKYHISLLTYHIKSLIHHLSQNKNIKEQIVIVGTVVMENIVSGIVGENLERAQKEYIICELAKETLTSPQYPPKINGKEEYYVIPVNVLKSAIGNIRSRVDGAILPQELVVEGDFFEVVPSKSAEKSNEIELLDLLFGEKNGAFKQAHTDLGVPSVSIDGLVNFIKGLIDQGIISNTIPTNLNNHRSLKVFWKKLILAWQYTQKETNKRDDKKLDELISGLRLKHDRVPEIIRTFYMAMKQRNPETDMETIFHQELGRYMLLSVSAKPRDLDSADAYTFRHNSEILSNALGRNESVMDNAGTVIKDSTNNQEKGAIANEAMRALGKLIFWCMNNNEAFSDLEKFNSFFSELFLSRDKTINKGLGLVNYAVFYAAFPILYPEVTKYANTLISEGGKEKLNSDEIIYFFGILLRNFTADKFPIKNYKILKQKYAEKRVGNYVDDTKKQKPGSRQAKDRTLWKKIEQIKNAVNTEYNKKVGDLFDDKPSQDPSILTEKEVNSIASDKMSNNFKNICSKAIIDRLSDEEEETLLQQYIRGIYNSVVNARSSRNKKRGNTRTTIRARQRLF